MITRSTLLVLCVAAVLIFLLLCLVNTRDLNTNLLARLAETEVIQSSGLERSEIQMLPTTNKDTAQ